MATRLNNFSCKQSSIEEVSLELTDDTLFVIGNGFNLMHGVPSSNYNFRDSISPRHILRSTMKEYIIKRMYGGNLRTVLPTSTVK